jgi:hypothetical protein
MVIMVVVGQSKAKGECQIAKWQSEFEAEITLSSRSVLPKFRTKAVSVIGKQSGRQRLKRAVEQYMHLTPAAITAFSEYFARFGICSLPK